MGGTFDHRAKLARLRQFCDERAFALVRGLAAVSMPCYTLRSHALAPGYSHRSRLFESILSICQTFIYGAPSKLWSTVKAFRRGGGPK